MMRFLSLAVVAALLTAALVAIVGWTRRQRALGRLAAADAVRGSGPADEIVDSALEQWLARAGYRGSNAAWWFVAATVSCALGGLVAGQVYRLSFRAVLMTQASAIPGGGGDLIAETINRGPIILFVVAALLPAMIVRARRRARVRAIEQDLPLALEMLATMAEAGLGFDAAISHIVKTRGAERPLMNEFVKFQLDMLAGVPRSQALRMLARRVHVPSLSGFASSLVQAEQVGASIAETLQHQAADLRQRRREDALLQAQALPVKLVFPLVICFLPGIFLSTLAPVLYQMVQVANSVLRSGQ